MKTDEEKAEAAFNLLLKLTGVKPKVGREAIVATIHEHVDKSLDQFYNYLVNTEPYSNESDAVRGLILTLFGKTMAARIEEQVKSKLALASMPTKGSA